MKIIPGISNLLKPLDDATDIFIKMLLKVYTFNPTCPVFITSKVRWNGINPFQANVLILYSLKKPENQRFSGVFRRYVIGCIGLNCN